MKRLIVVISDIATKEVMERWQFDIESADSPYVRIHDHYEANMYMAIH